MSSESVFRIAFWLLFGGMIVMQAYFASRVRRAGERVSADREAIKREGWGYAVVRGIASLALIAFLVLLAINPPWMEVLTVPLPDWLRWVGVPLGAVSFALYGWSGDYRTLLAHAPPRVPGSAGLPCCHRTGQRQLVLRSPAPGVDCCCCPPYSQGGADDD